MALPDLDALCEGAQMIPLIAAAILPKPFAGCGRELAERGWRDGHLKACSRD